MARRVAVSCLSGLVVLGLPSSRTPNGPGDHAAATAAAPPPVPREFRAAWLTPVDGGEWPSRPGLDTLAQQNELRALFDRAKSIGLNAVVLHVRPAADALYPTTMAPWSRYLVGDGPPPAPGYDPLAFAIREAHARGLQLHVWFNPFRAAPPDGNSSPVPGDIRTTHPEWVRHYGDAVWIDPGIPEARAAVLAAIMDVVQRYDIDGVHLDDYFYPYLEERTTTHTVGRGRHKHRVSHTVTLRFPDDGTWARYGVADGWTDRGDWRRANITDFVHALYQSVKQRKPWVLVGISPFGIWRPGHPDGITGLDAYSEIFADSREWLRNGWVDYLAPQLYWPLDGDEQRFVKLDAWWRTENPMHRHVWPGLLTMRTASQHDPWPEQEIPDEIAELRDARAGSDESLGHIHFRLRTLTNDDGALADLLEHTTYTAVALPPASPWLGAARPAAPQIATAFPAMPTALGVLTGSDDAITVSPSDSVPVRWWVVQALAPGGQWRTRIVPGDSGEVHFAARELPSVVAVSAVSRTGILSAPSIMRMAPTEIVPYVMATPRPPASAPARVPAAAPDRTTPATSAPRVSLGR